MQNMRKQALFLTAALLVLSLALVAAKIPGAEQGGLRLTASLSGADEVPSPGDADGSGKAVITLNPGKETVCWKIMVADIALPATGAHIHDAAAGVPGPVVVPLSPPDDSGMSSGCTSADRDLIMDIIHDVDGFYVNVHNADFPAGAVRGQLEK